MRMASIVGALPGGCLFPRFSEQRKCLHQEHGIASGGLSSGSHQIPDEADTAQGGRSGMGGDFKGRGPGDDGEEVEGNSGAIRRQEYFHHFNEKFGNGGMAGIFSLSGSPGALK